jgi:ParB/RepB/Spo0J family partition protein
MAKMQSGAGLREIPLSQIVDTGNVRGDYRDIKELAESIKQNGQLEPVLVKTLEKDADGIERYELIAGHRRYLAHRFLCDKGESVTSIKALIVTGDKLTLQLIENLQRADLTAAERESGIYEMCKHGLSQKEAAARLSKPEAFISRNVSAYKIREAAGAAGIDTSGLATGTLNEIQAAAAADYPVLVSEILQNGGTLEAARAVMEIYRIEHRKPANPRREKKQGPPPPAAEPGRAGALGDPQGIDPLSGPSFEEDLPDYLGEKKPADEPPEKPAPKTDSKKTPGAVTHNPWKEDFDPPHKQVDFNTMCLAIMEYGRGFERELIRCEKYDFQDDNDEGCCAERCGIWYMHETVMNIIALLHTRL